MDTVQHTTREKLVPAASTKNWSSQWDRVGDDRLPNTNEGDRVWRLWRVAIYLAWRFVLETIRDFDQLLRDMEFIV
jgi:hypothetical protein